MDISKFLLPAGLLVVAGLGAAGWLAQQIGGAFAGAGKQQHYATVDEVSDSLRSIGRTDLAYALNYEVARNNTEAFSLQQQQQEQGIFDSFGFGEIADILPVAILGYLLIKSK